MVEEKKEKKEEDSGIHIDLGLGGIFKGLGGIIESVSKLGNEFEDIDTSKTGEIKGLGDKIRGHYGFSFSPGECSFAKEVIESSES